MKPTTLRPIALVSILLAIPTFAETPATSTAPSTQAAKTGTIVGKVVDRNGNPVAGAHIYVNIRKPTRQSNMTKIAEATAKDDGTFEVAVPPHKEVVINIFDDGPGAWAKGGIEVKAGEKTDLGTIKIAPMQM